MRTMCEWRAERDLPVTGDELHCVAVGYSVLQCVAVCCSVLSSGSFVYRYLQDTGDELHWDAVDYIELQCVEVCCLVALLCEETCKIRYQSTAS